MNNLSLIEHARQLREQGLSLDEITQKLKKPRSSVYYWISKVPLTNSQQDELKLRMRMARLKGGETRKRQRQESIILHKKQGLLDINTLSKREIFLIGIALYWAEGAKQRSVISQPVEFGNQDPEMILLYIKWLDIIKVPQKDRQYTLYIHKQYKLREKEIKSIWETKLGNQIIKWENTVFKKHSTNRELSNAYLGLLRVRVRRSADLNRRINGWISALSSLARV